MASLSTSGLSFNLTVQATLNNLLESAAQASATMAADLIAQEITSGVSQNQIDRAWEETIEMTSGSTVSIDVRDFASRDIGAGSGNDALGQDLLMEEIALLIVQHVSGTGVLEINKVAPTDQLTWIPTDAARDAFGGGIGPGGMRIWYEPDTIGLDTSSSSKVIRFDALNGDVSFRLIIFGRHDDDESSSSSVSSSSSSSTSSSSTSS